MSVVLGVLLLSAGVRDAHAQYQYLYWSTGDSIALRPGSSAYAVLSMYTYAPSILPNQYSSTLTAYNVTLSYNAALQLDTVLTYNDYTAFALPTLTRAPGQVTIASSGTTDYPYYFYVALARVKLTLDAGATGGSVIDIQANSLSGYSGESLLPGLTVYPLRVCHATKVWGDLDDNGTVNSRDALIALSAAVGFSIAGFDGSVADLDQDGIITSRDALLILSAGLGFTDSPAGQGIADVCPVLPGAPPAMLARRVGGSR